MRRIQATVRSVKALVGQLVGQGSAIDPRVLDDKDAKRVQLAGGGEQAAGAQEPPRPRHVVQERWSFAVTSPQGLFMSGGGKEGSCRHPAGRSRKPSL